MRAEAEYVAKQIEGFANRLNKRRVDVIVSDKPACLDSRSAFAETVHGLHPVIIIVRTRIGRPSAFHLPHSAFGVPVATAIVRRRPKGIGIGDYDAIVL